MNNDGAQLNLPNFYSNMRAGSLRLHRDDEGADRLAKLGESFLLSTGSLLLAAGEEADCCYLITAGSVAASSLYASGEERVWEVFERGSVPLLSEVCSRSRAAADFRADGAISAVRIPRETLYAAMRSDPLTANAVIALLSCAALNARALHMAESSQNAVQKVCGLLLELAQNDGIARAGGVLIARRVSQQRMANALGMSRITVNKTIKALRADGLVSASGGLICLNKPEELARRCVSDLTEFENTNPVSSA